MNGFKIGDIVRYGNSCAKYIITGFGECNGKATWKGIDARGNNQGGTIMGSYNWDIIKIGHFNLESMFEAINCAD